jgi:omega-3 fatty acid desaturase (delta-15 desaturase)
VSRTATAHARDANALPPPATVVTLRDLRRVVPRECFVPSTTRSLAFLGGDLAVLAALYGLAPHAPWWLLPALWVAQGTMLWALFVIGHDCGHGAFSTNRRLESLVGHLTHTPLLVPYHAWRLSHRVHHRHAGHVERDEGWVPLTAAEVEALPRLARWLRFRAVLFALPFYLWRGTPGRTGSHYDPRCFPPRSRRAVATSIGLCGATALALVAWGCYAGPATVLRYWAAPWLVFVMWMDLVTYLHHTDAAVPWYRDGGWTFLEGALATVDRRYGPFERLHHDAGCHVVHHLFPAVPHYHLRRAAAAVAPALGERYRRATTPVHVALWNALRHCQVVPADGARVSWAALPTRTKDPG